MIFSPILKVLFQKFGLHLWGDELTKCLGKLVGRKSSIAEKLGNCVVHHSDTHFEEMCRKLNAIQIYGPAIEHQNIHTDSEFVFNKSRANRCRPIMHIKMGLELVYRKGAWISFSASEPAKVCTPLKQKNQTSDFPFVQPSLPYLGVS